MPVVLWHLHSLPAGSTTVQFCPLRSIYASQSSAAAGAERRLIVSASRRDHISPVLRNVLHWLSVLQRIQFEIAAAVFDCVRGIGPAYFKDVCNTVVDTFSRANLRSVHRGDMFVPRTRTQLSRRSFGVAATTVWNSLPLHRHPARHRCSPSSSRRQFRAGFITHLFNQAYTSL